MHSHTAKCLPNDQNSCETFAMFHFCQYSSCCDVTVPFLMQQATGSIQERVRLVNSSYFERGVLVQLGREVLNGIII